MVRLDALWGVLRDRSVMQWHPPRPKQGIPWQRVVNRQGCISLRSYGSPDPRQRILLEEEGIDFDHKGRIDLNRFLWQEVE